MIQSTIRVLAAEGKSCNEINKLVLAALQRLNRGALFNLEFYDSEQNFSFTFKIKKEKTKAEVKDGRWYINDKPSMEVPLTDNVLDVYKSAQTVLGEYYRQFENALTEMVNKAEDEIILMPQHEFIEIDELQKLVTVLGKILPQLCGWINESSHCKKMINEEAAIKNSLPEYNSQKKDIRQEYKDVLENFILHICHLSKQPQSVKAAGELFSDFYKITEIENWHNEFIVRQGIKKLFKLFYFPYSNFTDDKYEIILDILSTASLLSEKLEDPQYTAWLVLFRKIYKSLCDQSDFIIKHIFNHDITDSVISIQDAKNIIDNSIDSLAAKADIEELYRCYEKFSSNDDDTRTICVNEFLKKYPEIRQDKYNHFSEDVLWRFDELMLYMIEKLLSRKKMQEKVEDKKMRYLIFLRNITKNLFEGTSDSALNGDMESIRDAIIDKADNDPFVNWVRNCVAKIKSIEGGVNLEPVDVLFLVHSELYRRKYNNGKEYDDSMQTNRTRKLNLSSLIRWKYNMFHADVQYVERIMSFECSFSDLLGLYRDGMKLLAEFRESSICEKPFIEGVNSMLKSSSPNVKRILTEVVYKDVWLHVQKNEIVLTFEDFMVLVEYALEIKRYMLDETVQTLTGESVLSNEWIQQYRNEFKNNRRLGKFVVSQMKDNEYRLQEVNDWRAFSEERDPRVSVDLKSNIYQLLNSLITVLAMATQYRQDGGSTIKGSRDLARLLAHAKKFINSGVTKNISEMEDIEKLLPQYVAALSLFFEDFNLFLEMESLFLDKDYVFTCNLEQADDKEKKEKKSMPIFNQINENSNDVGDTATYALFGQSA
jgi:hypothetical protein